MGKYFFREKFFHNVKVIDDIIFKVRSICIKDIGFLTTLGWVRQSRKPLFDFDHNRLPITGGPGFKGGHVQLFSFCLFIVQRPIWFVLFRINRFLHVNQTLKKFNRVLM